MVSVLFDLELLVHITNHITVILHKKIIILY